MIGHRCGWEWAYKKFPLFNFSHLPFKINCSLISFLLIFLFCSLSVTLPPIISFPLPIHSSQPKTPLRSLAQPRWRWPAAAVEEASLACPTVLPVPSVYRWAVPLCGRRRAAGAGPLSPAVAVPPVSASWTRANQTQVSLLKTVRTNFSTSCICTATVVSLLDKTRSQGLLVTANIKALSHVHGLILM